MPEFEAYCDDSGTDANTPVAVAACYIASREQWDFFVRNWDEVREREGFDVFHMCEFMAKPEAGHKPFCDWDNIQKDRVYKKLASIINTRISRGFAIAVPKAPFDRFVFQEFKDGFAADHYTWAIRTMLDVISDWRAGNQIYDPMQYIFHHGSLSQDRIEQIWKSESKLNSDLTAVRYGMSPDGIQFQDDALFKPLQAADIFAWQVQNHMRRSVMVGIPSSARKAHPNVRMTLENKLVSIAYFGTEQLEDVFSKAKTLQTKPRQVALGRYPVPQSREARQSRKSLLKNPCLFWHLGGMNAVSGSRGNPEPVRGCRPSPQVASVRVPLNLIFRQRALLSPRLTRIPRNDIRSRSNIRDGFLIFQAQGAAHTSSVEVGFRTASPVPWECVPGLP